MPAHTKSVPRNDRETRLRLFNDNIKLAYYMARKMTCSNGRTWAKSCFTSEDMDQEALLALWNATGQFDGSRGFKFCTYACRCIYGQLVVALKTKGNMIRLPSHHDQHTRGREQVIIHSMTNADVYEEATGYDDPSLCADHGLSRRLYEELEGLAGEGDLNAGVLLNWINGVSLAEMSRVLGVSKERIRQRKARAVATARARTVVSS